MDGERVLRVQGRYDDEQKKALIVEIFKFTDGSYRVLVPNHTYEKPDGTVDDEDLWLEEIYSDLDKAKMDGSVTAKIPNPSEIRWVEFTDQISLRAHPLPAPEA